MKTKLRLLLALFASSASLLAAPLTSSTAVHTRPDASAPAISVLKAGTEPTPAIGIALALPPGWQAVELSGPHEAYIHGKDLTKNLDIKPGSEFRTQPKADAPVLATYTPGDAAEITGLQGKWTRFKLDKKITGYIYTGSATAPVAAATGKAAAAYTPAPAAAPAPAPVYVDSAPGRPAQKATGASDGGSSALPRLFKGTLVASKKLIGRAPFAFQLNDDGGNRYAYLDTSKLLLTEQVDKYIDRTVVVYGTARPVPDSKDIVIQIESLQLQ
ncbi:MAG: SH3 domain-containing protein [Nibricoccus sp.]